jgi:hypothetical protein
MLRLADNFWREGVPFYGVVFAQKPVSSGRCIESLEEICVCDVMDNYISRVIHIPFRRR